MEREFDTALEARKIADQMHQELRTMRYNKDIRRVMSNINNMISQLSSLEVEARRSHKPSIVETKRTELANAIDYVQKMMLIMRLMD